MGVTCDGSSGEQLQGSYPALLIGKLCLGVGVHGEVYGREGDVSQETRLGSLDAHTHAHGQKVTSTRDSKNTEIKTERQLLSAQV